MTAPTSPVTRAVLLDALGTTIELEPPWVHLAKSLGVEDPGELEPAVRKEMAFYREHAHEGKDAESLAALRSRCAEILSWELNREIRVETMMGAIRFRTYDDAKPALSSLRSAGITTVCVSNWDSSLPEVLGRCGLEGAFDAIVTSAEAGSPKPDPAIFEKALAAAGCGADEALHVGDTAEEDIAGAEAAGIRGLLLDRSGGGDISGLADVQKVLALV